MEGRTVKAPQSVKTRNFREALFNNALIIVLCALIVVIAIIEPKFLQLRVLKDILTQASVKLVVACGFLFVLLVGGNDLSAGRQVGLYAVIIASMMQRPDYPLLFWPDLPALPIIVPILLALLVAAICGLLNGYMVSHLKIPPFIATLGMQTIVYGACSLYFSMEPNNAQPIGGLRSDVTQIAKSYLFGEINVLILIALAVVLIAGFVLKKTVFGKNVYAVGGNLRAAQISGINTSKVIFSAYIIESCLLCFAALLEIARTGSATNSYGDGYEFDAISACVVGGVSLSGGIGKVRGAVIGVLIFTVINYGLAFLGINPNWQQVIRGLIICVAVTFDVKKNSVKN